MIDTRIQFGLVLLAAALAGGCVEKRIVNSSPTGLTPIPTQVQYAPLPQQQQPDDGFPNPFKWIGDGIGSLFKDDSSAQPMQVQNQGQTVKMPPGYSGQTSFTNTEGKNYNLQFQNGTLVGVEPQGGAKPAPAP